MRGGVSSMEACASMGTCASIEVCASLGVCASLERYRQAWGHVQAWRGMAKHGQILSGLDSFLDQYVAATSPWTHQTWFEHQLISEWKN